MIAKSIRDLGQILITCHFLQKEDTSAVAVPECVKTILEGHALR